MANTTGPQAVYVTIDSRVVQPGGSDTDLTHSYWRIIADDNQALTYDGRGNLTDDGIYQYTFDVRGRLTQVATKTTLDTDDVPTHLWVKLAYDYDPQGRRVTKKVYRWNDSLNGGAGGWSATPVTSLRFIWAGWNMLAEVDATTGKPVRSYLWGQDLSGGVGGAGGVDGLLAVRHHDATGAVEKRYDVVRDERSNVAGLIDENGKLVAGFEYTPFGQIAAIDSADPAVLADPASICPLLFSMKYLERELPGSANGHGQVYYFGYRYLDARLGKWLSRDPIAEQGGLNLYAYVNNDPVNYVDPVGLDTMEVFHQTTTEHAKSIVKNDLDFNRADGLFFTRTKEAGLNPGVDPSTHTVKMRFQIDSSVKVHEIPDKLLRRFQKDELPPFRRARGFD